MGILSGLFDSNEKEIAKLKFIGDQIEKLESRAGELSESEMKEKTRKWQDELQGKSYEEKRAVLSRILPEAFSLVREASKRTIGLRHFYVQLLGGVALHQGKIAEQKTGEGKTLTASSPIFLNALTGDGVHLVTQNDYLASRDAAWMGPIYAYLGLSVGVILQDLKAYIFDPSFENPEFMDDRSKKLRPVARVEAYKCDITYGTNHEFGFDYLRDNMVRHPSQISQVNPNGVFGTHNFAIVDEVDSLLIDVARTPLIISEPAEESTQKYYEAANYVSRLEKDTDYEVDEKRNTATLTDLGIKRVERMLNVDNLYEKDFETVHHMENAIKAKALFLKDRDYIVKDGKVVIVDRFTGRLLPSNRYSEGLHQAIEAKESVEIQRESRTLAEISYQNYFRMYKKLAGMTGTAETEAEEFHKIYNLDVVVIPTHKTNIRLDKPDVIYKSKAAKFRAIVNEIEEKNKVGQPILVGTTSVDNSELIHEFLKRKGIKHEILNAKNHEREALIIAQAGRKSAVTVSTNMAGRGVDIVLGGTPPDPKEQEEVKALGGLHVIGTERHESRRIDNQLRGRSARQGDPGSTRFFVSLQDDLMRIFGGGMVEKLMDRFGFDETVPIESGLVTSAIENAQKKVEGHNFDIRKNLLEFDDVMSKQREVIYKLRRRVLGVEEESGFNKEWFLGKVEPFWGGEARAAWDKWEKELGEDLWFDIVRRLSLEVVDELWVSHLDDMDDVREGIYLRGYAQKDPIVEYRKEGHLRFGKLVETVYLNIAERLKQISKIEKSDLRTTGQEVRAPSRMEFRHGEVETGVRQEEEEHKKFKVEPVKSTQKVGRNDSCPCGATKPDGTPVKYKNCHGRSAQRPD